MTSSISLDPAARPIDPADPSRRHANDHPAAPSAADDRPAGSHDLHDVAIVGFGPVSQVLALMLARLGYRVAIFERRLEAHALPRAVCVDHEAGRILRAIGLGAALDRVSMPAPRYQWFNADWEELLSIDWSAESLSGGPEVNFVHQPSLEAELRAAVDRCPTVELNAGWVFTALADRGDHVELTLRDGDDARTRTVRARYAVGADGANSAVREALGIGREDRGFQADWLVVDMRVRPGVTLDLRADCGQYCNPARPTTVVPGGMADGRVFRRWEFMRLPDETRESLQDEARVWDLLRPWVTPDQAELVRHTIYTFRSLIAERWHRGRTMLVGDAAHTMPPFMGQGMCAGFRDAWNLSWKLDLLLRGLADDRLLDSYAAERRPHVGAVVDASIHLGRIICIADPARAAERDRSYRDGTAEPMPPFPHLTAGLLAKDADGAPGPAAGLLCPHGRIDRAGSTGPWDEVVGLGFCVLVRDLDPATLLRPDRLRALKRLGIRLVGLAARGDAAADLVADVDGRYGRFLDEHGAIGMVLRPDFHVFGSAADREGMVGLVDDLLAELARNGVPSSGAAADLLASAG